MVIPGYEDPALAKFENALFAELCRQHDRVDLFVSSKADEILRRMGKMALFIGSLLARPFISTPLANRLRRASRSQY